MSNKVTITISYEHPAPWKGTIRSMGFVFVVIGVGVVLESPPMQWIGFVVTLTTAVSAIVLIGKRDVGLTIDQARARLDELESAVPTRATDGRPDCPHNGQGEASE